MDAAIISRIAQETSLPEASVSATVGLLEKGATGPFIVRYRKQLTGGLTDDKVGSIQERMDYYREVRDRQASLLKSLSEQGKLTDEIRDRIRNCITKVELDDLHHRFRSRKKTRLRDATEKGLQPLAEYFRNQEADAWSMEQHVQVYVDASKDLSSPEEALRGCVDIIAEWIGEKYEYRQALREMLEKDGFVISNVVPAKVNQKTKYTMYYERRESVTTIPSHRVLAIRRGCKEGILISSIEGDHSKALEYLLTSVIKDRESVFSPILEAAVRESYSRILKPLVETEVRTQLKDRADREAIRIFQENLTNLLLSPPSGSITVMGVDWGKDEECSVAVVDIKGTFLEKTKVRFTPSTKAPKDEKKKTKLRKAATPVETADKPEENASGVEQTDAPLKPDPEKISERDRPVQADAETGSVVPDETKQGMEVPPASAEESSPNAEEKPSKDPTESAGEAPTEAKESGIVPQDATGPETVAVNTDAKENTASTVTEAKPIQQPDPEIPAGTELQEPEPEPESADQSSGQMDTAFNQSQEKTSEQVAESESDGKPSEQETAEVDSNEQTTHPDPSAVLTQTPSVAPMTAPASKENQRIDKPVEAGDAPASGGSEDWLERTRQALKDLIVKHKVQAVSIGAGTHARELESSLRRIISEEKLGDIMIAAVNDAGIAIYSSSRVAREEFPDWTPSDRCAVSLARRLQDPLSELVKIDPKLIGVGQYQHDVDQKELHRRLLRTVQACVNKVGVNVNEAGDSLLRYVSGLNDKIARRITSYRNNTGAFSTRESIPAAVGLDPVVYEQAAAFLRIPDGDNVLDRTAIHPESYPVVEQMASSLGVQIRDLIGNREKIDVLKLEDFATETTGIATLKDIREELLKPGKDPRKKFKLPKFRTDVTDMSQLNEGMTLEGIVTNVTNFGAFVDIGVRQDGLVHLSQMSNRFIRDPREAVKVGDIVQVKVISVEPETKRIGLSMKALLPSSSRKRRKQQRNAPGKSRSGKKPAQQASGKATGRSGDTASTHANNKKSVKRHSKSTDQDSSNRHRRKESRRPEKTRDPDKKQESKPEEPERSLQEKIAILQSKFRRIH